MGIFSKARPENPVQVPGDGVVAVHYLDDQFHNKALLLDYTYRFDDVLDPLKLKHAFERVLELEGWRRLGGRLRLNERGKLDWHVPQRYDEKRPGVLYHHVRYEQNISDHPLASQLPRASDSPAVYQDPINFHVLAHPDHPTNIEGFLYSDKPPIAMSIWSFNDATLLTLSWSHVLLDAVGRQSLFTAWTAVLAGREQDVPRFIGFSEDPMDALAGKTPSHKHVLRDQLMSTWSFMIFIVYTIFEHLFYPKQENRLISIPDRYVQSLKKQARDELAREQGSKEAPFLSDGDVVFAWWAQLTVSALPISPNRTIFLGNVFNLRGVVESVVPSDSAFIGNLASTLNTYLPAKQLIQQSIGKTALMIRETLLQQRSTEQAEALLTLNKECAAKKKALLFGPPDQVMVTLSNWHRARLFDFDFDPAVIRQGLPNDRRANAVGRPSLISTMGHSNGFSIRNGGSLQGRDAAGNWWIVWAMRTQAWPIVEAKIRAMAERKLD